jgi:hypothetical protein
VEFRNKTAHAHGRSLRDGKIIRIDPHIDPEEGCANSGERSPRVVLREPIADMFEMKAGV